MFVKGRKLKKRCFGFSLKLYWWKKGGIFDQTSEKFKLYEGREKGRKEKR